MFICLFLSESGKWTSLLLIMNLPGLMEGLDWFWVNLLGVKKRKCHKHHEHQRALSDTCVIQVAVMQAAKGLASAHFFFFLRLPCQCQSEHVPGAKGIQGHPGAKPSPAQCSSASSCSCSTPLGSCSTTEEEKAAEQRVLQRVGNSQVMSHVPSLQAGNGAEAQ